MSFVGGSLVPRGGHNLIEPAALGSPIILGTYTFNFEDIVQRFVDDEACIRVQNEDELLDAIELFAGDSNIANQYAIGPKRLLSQIKAQQRFKHLI